MKRHSQRTFMAATFALAVIPAAADAQVVHQYRFNGSGPVVVDEVGSADGLIIGGATLTGSGALAFDGVDDYVDLPTSLLGSQASATFEAWYTWQDPGAPNWPRIMDFGNSTGGVGAQGSGLTYCVLTPQSIDSGTPTAAVRLMPSGSSTKGLSQVAPALGVEAHVALVFDASAGEIRLFLDGALQDITPIAQDLTDLVDENCWLGRSQFGTDPYFEGSISEFRIYGNAISDLEVMESFLAGPDGGPLGMAYCAPSVPNSTGVSATISATGNAVATVNGFTLGAAGLPRNSFSFFLASRTQGLVNQPGGSDGVLCLGGAIGRYIGPGQIQQAGMAGTISLGLDLTQVPQPNGFEAALAGETWNFQAWYRDVDGSGATSNFTDALSMTFQ